MHCILYDQEFMLCITLLLPCPQSNYPSQPEHDCSSCSYFPPTRLKVTQFIVTSILSVINTLKLVYTTFMNLNYVDKYPFRLSMHFYHDLYLQCLVTVPPPRCRSSISS